MATVKASFAVLRSPECSVIVVEHRDRLVRFGSGYREAALAATGRRLIVVDPRRSKGRSARPLGPSRPLSERVFGCKACGEVIDRDLNAARSLAAVAGGSPGTLNACGVEASGQENGLVQPAASK